MINKKVIKNISMLILIIPFIYLLYFGLASSDFSNLKKYDDKNFGSGAAWKDKMSERRYYNTDVVVQSNDKYATLGDFTVNVSDNKKMIANISIQCKDECSKELEKNGAVIRNAVIKTIDQRVRAGQIIEGNSRSIEDLKKNIKKNINSLTNESEVEEVFFTKLIYQ